MSAPVDLRSDTKTRPTAAMRAAMTAAEVGDEQVGEDPTCRLLEERVAALLGTEAGMFVPTGTMCNLLALLTLARPGDAVIVERTAHIARSETGGAAAVAGVMLREVDGRRGHFGPDAVRTRLSSGTRKAPRTVAVCLEQTHNFAGGALWPHDVYVAVAEAARAEGLAVHVDGARLLNAVVATGEPAEAWGGCVDTVWLDFSKGLGAPMGAVLCGPTEVLDAAQRHRHMLGGAMRQAGIVAAGCLHALDHHVERLAEDHARAQRLALALAHQGWIVEEPVETNMVFFEPEEGPEQLLAALAEHGVLMSAMGTRVRAVTHLDIDDDALGRAIAALAAVA